MESTGISAAFAGAQKAYKFTSDQQFRNEVIVNTVALMVLMNAAYSIYQYRLMQSFVMLTASTTFLMYRDAFVLANIRDTAASLETVNVSLIGLTEKQTEYIKKLEGTQVQLQKNVGDLENKLKDFGTLNEGGKEVLESQRAELLRIQSEITEQKSIREQTQAILKNNLEQAEAARKVQEKMDNHLATQMQSILDRETKVVAREEALRRKEEGFEQRQLAKV